jgi:L-fucose mutarotase
MLKGIDPLISPDLVYVLASMGHGDELAIVDANFPAATMGRRVVRLDGVDSKQALSAVLSLLPLDDFVEFPLAVMQVVGSPETTPETVRDFERVVRATQDSETKIDRIERNAFYERAKGAFAVLATGEKRLYGCILVKKGVIRPT